MTPQEPPRTQTMQELAEEEARRIERAILGPIPGTYQAQAAGMMSRDDPIDWSQPGAVQKHKDRGGLVLEPSQILCGWHRPMFESDWPKGYTTFAVVGLQAAMNTDGMSDSTGPEDTFRRLCRRPVCCRLEREALTTILTGVDGFAKSAVCEECQFEVMCVSFQRINHYGRKLTKHKHLCLACCCKHAERERAIWERKQGTLWATDADANNRTTSSPVVPEQAD